MKKYTFLAVLLIAFEAGAYQAGTANRTNFGPGQAQSGQQYRSFSNYNNRSWGQGVQTRGVQTQVAGTEVADFEAPAKPKATPAANAVKKQVGEEPKAHKPTAAAANQAQAATAPAAQQNAMPPEAAAMMQQVQGLMNSMGGAMAQPQGQTPAQAGQSAQAAAMPDISALMGGMMPAQPQATPAKK